MMHNIPTVLTGQIFVFFQNTVKMAVQLTRIRFLDFHLANASLA